MVKVPESVVTTPLDWPRIVTETPVKIFSFSPMTFPLTVADFFCANENEQIRINNRDSPMRLVFTKADFALK